MPASDSKKTDPAVPRAKKSFPSTTRKKATEPSTDEAGVRYSIVQPRKRASKGT